MWPTRQRGGMSRQARARVTRERMKCTETKLLTRREAVLGLLGAAVGVRAIRAGAAGTPRAASVAQRSPFTEVARGLFIRSGIDEDASASNGGAIANIGFIVGTDCVATMDAGGSLEDGEALRAAIRAHTSRPIRYVILSHAHPDHV